MGLAHAHPNNVEVTVNTSTCTDVQQSTNQVEYNSYSIGDQGFMAAKKQTLLSGYDLRLGLFTALPLC